MYFTNRAVKVSRSTYIDFFASILYAKWYRLEYGENFKIMRDIVVNCYTAKRGEEPYFYFNSGQVTKWIYMIDLYETALTGEDRDKKMLIAAKLLFKFLIDLNENKHIRPDYLTYAYSRKLPPKDGIQGRKRHINLTEEEREFINNLPKNTEDEVKVYKVHEAKFLQSN